MKKKLLLILAVILVLSIGTISVLADTDEDHADGVWLYLPQFPPAYSQEVGDNLYSSTRELGEWSGTFEGASEETGFVLFQNSTGRGLFIATVNFASVEVGGVSGGLEMYVIGDRPDGNSDWQGTWVITSGTGALEDLEGEGDWWGPGWQGDPEEYGVIYYSVEDLDGPGFADIDIKPGHYPNSINLKHKGKIPVAVLTTEDFDATTVDPLSVAFGPNGAAASNGKGHVKDVDNDGDLDLLLHFRTQETGIQCGDTSASLSGNTYSGQPIMGYDSIITVGCK